ncbi:MAG: Rossmann-like and DUF2520 domain-containing protein [Maribacter sp.]|uniref:Rossmann-like and DUF2520 domain-containing protein n=1 Tax=Maribacter sp. TaxID=1897614 RepID=UPI003C76FBB6
MIRIVILGTGNVAKHLYKAFKAQDSLEVVQVYGRNPKALRYFEPYTKTTSELSNIMVADVYMLAVSDDAIGTLSKQLNLTQGILVHTSGSVAMNLLPNRMGRGVFYPLQTFSENRVLDFKEIPICIEASDDDGLRLLTQLASALSETVVPLNSKKRRALHLAAVFANNFTNHMYHLSHEFCDQKDVPFKLLLPLIKETADKLEGLSPYDAQTGPARRNDKGTLKKHLSQLKSENHKKIYSLLSKSIQTTYGKKL